ncbi:MAG: metal-dependent phosphohydrolase [Rhodospirillales bacterium CG15_BIG_FIL_POST_REV_8_21_14_020_66_15]|nr:MAG: metal-dependent phosphohydrolase [Rhodospirillales bacterium CG15_BIG_FIL_POST_REV_8_21_14_020_66_15]
MTNTPLSQSLDIYVQLGTRPYTEVVSQLEHALQCAWLAERESGDRELIAAAFLHDIGHLMHKFGQEAADRGIDDKHEAIARGWVARHFTARVAQAVGLHVEAKRYLCAARPGYFETLSPASVKSLELQGGPMNADEVSAFEALPDYADAVRVREWDDRAKTAGLETPGIDHFRPYLESALAAA